MNRQALIAKIVQQLSENGTLEVENYCTRLDQLYEIQEIIIKGLDGYLIVKGEVIE